MLEFTAGAKAASEPTDGTPIKMDDDRVVTFHQPSSGAFAVAAARMSGDAAVSQTAAATINFFMSMLDEDDANYFETRLFTNTFSLDDVQGVLEILMGEWSGRPTS